MDKGYSIDYRGRLAESEKSNIAKSAEPVSVYSVTSTTGLNLGDVTFDMWLRS